MLPLRDDEISTVDTISDETKQDETKQVWACMPNRVTARDWVRCEGLVQLPDLGNVGSLHVELDPNSAVDVLTQIQTLPASTCLLG